MQFIVVKTLGIRAVACWMQVPGCPGATLGCVQVAGTAWTLGLLLFAGGTRFAAKWPNLEIQAL